MSAYRNQAWMCSFRWSDDDACEIAWVICYRAICVVVRKRATHVDPILIGPILKLLVPLIFCIIEMGQLSVVLVPISFAHRSIQHFSVLLNLMA